MQEKEEEFESTRKNYQRTIDSMQASLEAEVKGKQDALRTKKKIEADINELEFLNQLILVEEFIFQTSDLRIFRDLIVIGFLKSQVHHFNFISPSI